MAQTPNAPAQSGNRLLARLPERDLKRLASSLESVPLTVKTILYKVRAPIDYVYFPTSGIISAMTVMQNGSAIEVATIGREGMSGLTTFVGGKISPYEVMVQVEGTALRMKADAFITASHEEGPLRQLFVRYHTAFSMQVSYAVACNGLHTVEKRCARWLLMTQDRVGANVLPLTHEFLAIMLGVRRATITEVLRPLQERGIVHNGRGAIEILDRPPALQAHACECYRAVEEEFAHLLG